MNLSLGALPQAVTFRAFGAETQSFHTPSVAGGGICTGSRYAVHKPHPLPRLCENAAIGFQPEGLSDSSRWSRA
jgi:hypothetical protein